jgi:hypothetical protein
MILRLVMASEEHRATAACGGHAECEQDLAELRNFN